MKEILFSGGIPKDSSHQCRGDNWTRYRLVWQYLEIVASGAAADFPSEKLAPNQSSPASSRKVVIAFCKIMLIAKMESGSCFGSRAYTRIQFSHAQTPLLHCFS